MEATVARELGGNQTAFKEKMGDNLVLERVFGRKFTLHKKKPGKRRPKPPFPGAKLPDKESDQ